MNDDDDLETLDRPPLTADDVNRRADDWIGRLNDLFSEIKTWAGASGWSTTDGPSVYMEEEILHRFNIARRKQPSLSVHSPDGTEIRLKPKGLWVIGANGRVDLYSRRNIFTLIDIADAFQPPQWILHRIGKREGQDFRPDILKDMI